MRLSSILVLGGSIFVCACGGGDDGGGSGGSSSGGAAGSTSSGGSTASGGGGGSGAVFAAGECLPSEQAGDHCADSTYQYEFFCAPNASPTPPAADCQDVTSPLPAGSGWCCSQPMCQRQIGTEYLCTDASKPNSYVCHADAPAPADCVTVGAIGKQYCCP